MLSFIEKIFIRKKKKSFNNKKIENTQNPFAYGSAKELSKMIRKFKLIK